MSATGDKTNHGPSWNQPLNNHSIRSWSMPKKLGASIAVSAIAVIGVANAYANTGSQVAESSPPLDSATVETPAGQAEMLPSEINYLKTQSVQATVSSGSATSVNVNGQEVTVPANGSINQTITSADGSSTVNVNVQNSSTTNSQSSTSHSSINSSSNTTSSSSQSEQEP